MSESSPIIISPLRPHASVVCWQKRGLDIIGAIVGLAITAIFLVPLAIAIKLESRGPVFFVQTRIGYRGKPFRMWKFRSMIVNAEALKSTVPNQLRAEGKFFKNANDPRVTKVGQFLRRTSLDEFPQFWNVLQGDMSLVGTRPPTPDEVVRYNPYEWQRLNVKPGITGEWQVNGRSAIETFSEVVALDLRYQEHWDLIYDLKIIIKTLLALVIKHRNAY
jgi:lipopolysaccharide/colanic/teichoic acid biosynthesis glycosyltransferase